MALRAHEDELAHYVSGAAVAPLDTRPMSENSGGLQPHGACSSSIGGVSRAPVSPSTSVPTNVKFPSFRSVLWDRTPKGNAIVLDAERFLPQVEISIPVLQQLAAIADHEPVSQDQIMHILNASLRRDRVQGGDSLKLVVDSMQGSGSDDQVDFEVFHNVEFSASMYASFVQRSLVRIGARDGLHYGNYVLTRLCVSKSCTSGSSTTLGLYGEHFAPALSISICEINPLRLVSTPLSLSLQNRTLSATFNSGYLTLDQYRNAVPLLDTDAAAFNAPLVGAWIYGQCSLQSLEVWMACVRFLYNASIKDRVTVAAMSFLLAFFDTSSSSPSTVFSVYECTANLKGSRLCHVQFGSEVRLLKDSVQMTPISFSWHPILDESSNFRFAQAAQGRIPPAPMTPSPRCFVGKPGQPGRHNSPAKHPLKDCVSEEKPMSALNVSQCRVPAPRPLPAIVPCPRPPSSNLAMSAPPAYPSWVPPHTFYEQRICTSLDPAAPAVATASNVPSQEDFDSLRKQLTELQRRFDEFFSKRNSNEAATNTSFCACSKQLVSQATSTNGLSLNCASSSPCASIQEEDLSLNNIGESADLCAKEKENSSTKQASFVAGLSANEFQGQNSAVDSAHVSQVSAPSRDLHASQTSKSTSTALHVERSSLNSTELVSHSSHPSVTSNATSGRMSIEELSDNVVADQSNSHCEATFFDIPRIEFTPDESFEDLSDDDCDDYVIARRYFNKRDFKQSGVHIDNDLENRSSNYLLNSSSLLMRVDFND